MLAGASFASPLRAVVSMGDALNAHGGAYGGMMPVGTTPVTVGQVEFIRTWIQAGAPRDGYVADSTLLTNATAQATPGFAPLPAPDAIVGERLESQRRCRSCNVLAE